MKISFSEKLTKDEMQVKEKDLIATEHARGINLNYKRFNIVLRKNNSQLIGHLDAYTAFSEIYIDDLWIHSNYRGQGFGKQLLAFLEQRFEGQGFNNINLVTSDFSAPGFYKKCGYTLEFVRKNKVNPQFTKYFFVKFFKNKKQTQGLINSK